MKFAKLLILSLAFAFAVPAFAGNDVPEPVVSAKPDSENKSASDGITTEDLKTSAQIFAATSAGIYLKVWGSSKNIPALKADFNQKYAHMLRVQRVAYAVEGTAASESEIAALRTARYEADRAMVVLGNEGESVLRARTFGVGVLAVDAAVAVDRVIHASSKSGIEAESSDKNIPVAYELASWSSGSSGTSAGTATSLASPKP